MKKKNDDEMIKDIDMIISESSDWIDALRKIYETYIHADEEQVGKRIEESFFSD